MINYIHEILTRTENPIIVIYEVVDNDEDNSRVLIGDIEKVREFMKDRTNMGREDDTMTEEKLDDDKTLFEYIDFWGYVAQPVAEVTLKDFKIQYNRMSKFLIPVINKDLVCSLV